MTEKLFSDLEGLRIAMEIEARGRDFYHRAFDRAEEGPGKELLRMLMRDEVLHYETFSGLFDELSRDIDAASKEYLFDAESSRYLTVLAELHVFPAPAQVDEVVSGMKNLGDIFRLALQAEKDSVLFYDALAAESRFESARRVFVRLKAEEQAHVVKISALQASMA